MLKLYFYAGFMFTSFALLLPFCICVLGALLFFFKRHKHTSQQLMLALNVLCLVYFCADTMLLDGDMGWFSTIGCSALRQFVGPMLLPLLLLFKRSMLRSNYYSWTTGFWFIPSVMLGSVCFILYSLMGVDNAAAYASQCNSPEGIGDSIYAEDTVYQLHYLFARQIYMIVMLIEMVYVIGYLVYLMVHSGYTPKAMLKLLRTGGSVPVVNLLLPVLIFFLILTGIRLGVGRAFLLSHLGVAATCNFLMAMFIICVNYLTLYANRSPVTLRTLRSPLSSADSAKKYHYGAEREKPDTPVEGMSALSYAELVDGFKALVMVERIFLEPTVSVEDVAMRLHSNRTYVSCMVSKEFGMNFRDYLASLRVDYAQKYMKAHPSATQDEVAQASGFSSASTFNKKFRQTVGISPRQWQINN